ncbi:MAG TPA: hypothetical protein VJT67_16365 [Longimicrobiaceae bacterium]|nr:hypothetical protein [Longimicrobiaceae bacterium]
MVAAYDDNVFINCPFDDAYRPLFRALVFAIHDCGLEARSALELDDGAEVRIEKIQRIIGECRHSIHDLSRTELDVRSGLPRMNMPFELGLFLGAKRYGTGRQKRKTSLIFDAKPYRYQKFLSDLAGHDIRTHGNDEVELIKAVRNALATTRPTNVALLSGRLMGERYTLFLQDLPALCAALKLDPDDLGHRDLAHVVTVWLKRNPGRLDAMA